MQFLRMFCCAATLFVTYGASLPQLKAQQRAGATSGAPRPVTPAVGLGEVRGSVLDVGDNAPISGATVMYDKSTRIRHHDCYSGRERGRANEEYCDRAHMLDGG